jgi:hypothetical protein
MNTTLLNTAMLPEIEPIVENENVGYFFSVNEKQIAEHKKRSVSDIFNWLEANNRFVYELQNTEERLQTRIASNSKLKHA